MVSLKQWVLFFAGRWERGACSCGSLTCELSFMEVEWVANLVQVSYDSIHNHFEWDVDFVVMSKIFSSSISSRISASSASSKTSVSLSWARYFFIGLEKDIGFVGLERDIEFMLISSHGDKLLSLFVSMSRFVFVNVLSLASRKTYSLWRIVKKFNPFLLVE